jgi:Fe-S-cluster containining protein
VENPAAVTGWQDAFAVSESILDRSAGVGNTRRLAGVDGIRTSDIILLRMIVSDGCPFAVASERNGSPRNGPPAPGRFLYNVPPGGPDVSEVWYQGGLRFSCTRCGDCCTGEPGYVWVDVDDLEAIAEFRGETFDEVVGLYTKEGYRGLTLREKGNGDCVFFERGRGCTIYAVRPPQCRTWPFWESNVATPAAWRATCEACPGSGRGELISAEEITRRTRVIRL